MYKDHKVFRQPANENEKVWRYMDFTKFVSLLESRSLYFTRADRYDDPFEGSYPRINVMARQVVPDDVPEEHKDKYRESMAKLGNINRNWPRYTAINCWHLNNHESAAMWRLYLKSNEGIAIQSTYQKLRDCFAKANEDIYLGLVKYIDYETEWIEVGNLLTPFVHKRKSFEHEREVRAVVMKWPPGDDTGLDFTQETISHGLHFPIDLGLLIEHIYVAPDAPQWFAGLVDSVTKCFGDHYPVIQSKLNQEPLY